MGYPPLSGSGSYQTGIADLQTMLSDQPTDKYNYLQRCFGVVNGGNLNFKTFFRRRATNFTVAGSGGVYVTAPTGGAAVLLPATAVASDNVETGEFVLSAGNAPADGSIVEASYYNQWFDVGELDSFLQLASSWLQGFVDYTQTPTGLMPALQKYAAAEAYQKMAMRWRTYMSQEYKVEDAPKDSPTYGTDDFRKLADQYRKEALAARTEFFQNRQGRALAPNSGSIHGGVRSMP